MRSWAERNLQQMHGPPNAIRGNAYNVVPRMDGARKEDEEEFLQVANAL